MKANLQKNYVWLDPMAELASIAFCSNHFALILARALFLQTGHRANEYAGKIWLDYTSINKSQTKQLKEQCLQIPPGQKIIDFFSFFDVFKQIQKGIIESLRIGDGIGPRENGRRGERKANLRSISMRYKRQWSVNIPE